MRSCRWILAGLIAFASGAASAVPSFQGLGDLAGGSFDSFASGVSGDGAVVVGWSRSTSGQQAFRWTPTGGLVGLGDLPGGTFLSAAQGVNDDGTVVVGNSFTASGSDAFRWTQGTGMVSLGGSTSEARAVSADGSLIVGQPFRWTEATGVQVLSLPAGYASASAGGVSADGTIIAGHTGRSVGGGVEGFRWTESTGIVPLGDVPGHTPPPGSRLAAVSADGSTLSGFGSNSGVAVIWTQSGGFQVLDGPAGSTGSNAGGMSADGSTIVGSASFADLTSEAMLWNESGAFVLAELLSTEFGIDLTGWQLRGATDISDDGRTIVGVGTNPSGQNEAWIAVIPEPSTALLLGLGLTAWAARSRIHAKRA